MCCSYVKENGDCFDINGIKIKVGDIVTYTKTQSFSETIRHGSLVEDNQIIPRRIEEETMIEEIYEDKGLLFVEKIALCKLMTYFDNVEIIGNISKDAELLHLKKKTTVTYLD